MDTSTIREHMEVVGSDSGHIGSVDHVDDHNRIKLARTDPAAGGVHHWISIDDVERVDDRVVLRVDAATAKLRLVSAL